MRPRSIIWLPRLTVGSEEVFGRGQALHVPKAVFLDCMRPVPAMSATATCPCTSIYKKIFVWDLTPRIMHVLLAADAPSRVFLM